MNIGKQVKMLRERYGITQEELATGIGMSQPVVSKIEKGEVGIKLDTAVTIAKYFGITIDTLVKGDNG